MSRAELDVPHGPRLCPELFRSEKVHSHWVPVLLFLTLPAAAMRSFRENAMHNASIISALMLMLSFIGSAAQAQIAPQQTPAQDVLVAAQFAPGRPSR